jgi:MFS family permease
VRSFWGIAQLGTGALSDRIGRKWLISTGIAGASRRPGTRASSTSYGPWSVAVVLLGLGTAMVYPTLRRDRRRRPPDLAARAVGVYRLWRDAGLAPGALLAGLIADLWGLTTAVWVVAALTAGSGLIVVARMYETTPAQGPAADRRVKPPARWMPPAARRPFPGTRDRWSRAHTTLDL